MRDAAGLLQPNDFDWEPSLHGLEEHFLWAAARRAKGSQRVYLPQTRRWNVAIPIKDHYE